MGKQSKLNSKLRREKKQARRKVAEKLHKKKTIKEKLLKVGK